MKGHFSTTTKGQTTYNSGKEGFPSGSRPQDTGQGEPAFLHFPMVPLGPLSLLPLLSLCVGALLSSDASPDCTQPPCRDTLVAAPIQPRTGAGVGTVACEGQPGTAACRMGVSLPAVSEVPRMAEHRHEFAQVKPKVSDVTYSATKRDVLSAMLTFCLN